MDHAPLPIESALPEVRATLSQSTRAILVAPPGAGKTTRVPLALLNADWRNHGKIIVLVPRRLAARAAASRMAEALGEPVGKTVGYRVRLDSAVGPETKIEVVTTGIFLATIQADPELTGIAAVLFDEFHERSLDGDLALALALDAQAGLRDDVRLLIMSATLDGARIADLLSGAPIIESQGKAFPVETHYRGHAGQSAIDEAMARAIRYAIETEEGSVLAFLPGAAEIGKTAKRLEEAQLPPSVSIHPLMGMMDLAQQNQAIAPSKPGARKVVLATSIAETSLTIEGVRVIIDSGLARRPLYEPERGLTSLVTRRVSRAAAEQRRGRAGRTQPGVCIRLWDRAEEGGFPSFDRPEILDADLAPLVLAMAAWGVHDSAHLIWLDKPPAPAWSEARALLQRLGALDAKGAITEHGRALIALPMPPRLAHMVIKAPFPDQQALAAHIAAMLSERGVGSHDIDLRHRFQTWQNDRSLRAKDLRRLADSWAPRKRRQATAFSDEILNEIGTHIAMAYPDWIARARPSRRGGFVLVNGRGVELEPKEALAGETWLAVAEMAGSARGTRIVAAAPLSEAEALQLLGPRIESSEEVLFERETGRLKARRRRTAGAIILDDVPIQKPTKPARHRAWLNTIREYGLGLLPWHERTVALRKRAAFVEKLELGVPIEGLDLSDQQLLATLGTWLPDALGDAMALQEISGDSLHSSVADLLPWDGLQRLDQLAPATWTAPTGTQKYIDYPEDGPPQITIRVQELYGLKSHPMLGKPPFPLRFCLVSPAHRPIQITQDLPAFWQGSWRDVRSEMKARYPRHEWPIDPANAEPTTRAKPRNP